MKENRWLTSDMPALHSLDRPLQSGLPSWLGFTLRLIWAPFHAILIVVAPFAILLLSLVTIAGLLMIGFFVGVLHQPHFPWAIMLGVSVLSAMLAVLLQDLVRRL